MNKKILTVSWLVKKAMSMAKKDPAEYEKLISIGTDKMVKGLVVQLSVNEHQHWPNVFAIRVPGSPENYCQIHSVKYKGKLYGYYTFSFQTTHYRKRITDKYLPITLPEGVKCRTYGNQKPTQCLYHNADGSLANTGTWTGGRRGRPGTPDMYVVLNEETGSFVGDRALRHEVAQHAGQGSVQSNYGFYHAASSKRSEWLRSFECLDGLCDMRKVLKIAAETYRMAARLCEKHKGLSITLFPAAKADGSDVVSRLQATRIGGRNTPRVVLARDETLEPTMCYLPEVVLSWDFDVLPANHSVGQSWGGLIMQIVPHGNPLLDPAGYGAQLARHYRLPVDVPRNFLNSYDVIDKAQVMSRAYHSLPAYDPTVPADQRDGITKYWGWVQHGKEHPYSKEEAKLVVWPKHRDKVRVSGFGEGFGDLFPQEAPVAQTPESISLLLEEQMLIGSLPLC